MVFLPLLSFIILAASMALFSKRKIEITLPLTALVVIVTLYLSGLIGSLLIGLYLLWLATGIGIIYVVRQLIVNFTENHRLIIRPGLVVFLVVFVISVVWHRYDVVNTWDELAQWALAAKNSFILNTFANTPLSNKAFLDYPPAVELFHYFWTKTSMVFGDSSLYISMNMLIVSFLISALQEFSFKKYFRTIFAAVVILIAPYALYSWVYTRLLVDPLMGILFGWTLYIYYTNRKNLNRFIIFLLSFGVLVLPLIKVLGLFFAIMAIILIGIDRISLSPSGKKLKSLLRLLPLVISAFIAKLTWAHELSSFKIGNTFNYKYALSYHTLYPWQKQAFVNFYKSLFNYHAIKNTTQTSYYLGPFTTSAIVVIVLLTALTIWTLILYKRKGKAFFIGLIIGVIFYIIPLSFLYLLILSEGENTILSSFSRYINTYLIAILLLCVSLLLNKLANTAISHAKIIYSVLIILLLVVHIKLKETPLEWLNPQIAKRKMVLYSDRTKYNTDINQLRQYLPVNAVLHIFNGDIAGALYDLCPVKVNSPLWQSADFKWYRQFAKQLGYTHVFFEATYGSIETNNFKKNFDDLLLPGSNFKNYSLYEVIWENNKPMMRFIVQLKPFNIRIKPELTD